MMNRPTERPILLARARLATVCLAAVCTLTATLSPASPLSAQEVSLEFAGGYDHLINDLQLGELDTGRRVLFPHRSGNFDLDSRLAIRTGELWEFGAAFSLTRTTFELQTATVCLESRQCSPSPRTISSQDYTELVSALVTGRHWPMGVADRRLAPRPLVGFHTGVLWHDDARDRNWGVPVGFDVGAAMAMTDRTYLLSYATGQMLLVSRRPFHDGFGFRLGFRLGLGIHL